MGGWKQRPHFTDEESEPRAGRETTHRHTGDTASLCPPALVLGEWGGGAFCPPASQSASSGSDKGSGCSFSVKGLANTASSQPHLYQIRCSVPYPQVHK